MSNPFLNDRKVLNSLLSLNRRVEALELSGAGHTLDAAYDGAGAGAGRSITVDSGPVVLNASGASALDVDGDITFTSASGADILWTTDGGGNIGGSAANRPASIYVTTNINSSGTIYCASTLNAGSFLLKSSTKLYLTVDTDQAAGVGIAANVKTATDYDLALINSGRTDGASNRAITSVWDTNAATAPVGKIHSFGWTDNVDAYNEVAAVTGSAVTLGGSADLIWTTDGGGDIGASGANRPNNVFIKTNCTVGNLLIASSGIYARGPADIALLPNTNHNLGFGVAQAIRFATAAHTGILANTARTDGAGNIALASVWDTNAATAPVGKIHSFGWTDNTDTYNEVAAVTGSALLLSAHLTVSADNTYDLGAPGSRPRNVYAASTLVAGKVELPSTSYLWINGAGDSSAGFGNSSYLREAQPSYTLVFHHLNRTDGASNIAIASTWDRNAASAPSGYIHSFGWTDNTDTFNQVFGVKGAIVEANVPVQVPSYTVAGVPSASPAGQVIYVSDETGGAVLAFSDGTNFRRVTDRAIVA